MTPEPLTEIKPVAVMHSRTGSGIFFEEVSGDSKQIVLFTHLHEGMLLEDELTGKHAPRPLTHGLLCSIVQGVDAQTPHLVISDYQDGYFKASITLRIYNEAIKKIVELDARPSDVIIMSAKMNIPLFIRTSIWEELEDVSFALENIKSDSPDSQQPVYFK